MIRSCRREVWGGGGGTCIKTGKNRKAAREIMRSNGEVLTFTVDVLVGCNTLCDLYVGTNVSEKHTASIFRAGPFSGPVWSTLDLHVVSLVQMLTSYHRHRSFFRPHSPRPRKKARRNDGNLATQLVNVRLQPSTGFRRPCSHVDCFSLDLRERPSCVADERPPAVVPVSSNPS
jgi:hypothetical protein